MTDDDAKPKDLASTIADSSGPAPGQDETFTPGQPRLPLPGAGIGPRFTVLEEIGRGANGRVLRVLDRELERDVAVKVLAPGAAGGDIDALLREARIAARLEHPNIVPVYDIATTTAGHLWFAMKRIDGMSLAAAIDEAAAGQAPAAIADLHRRADVVLHICNAVSAAHARSLVHRDIKPANVMLGRFGEVLLVDWGTASEGSVGGRVGTPLYMSPEQARGEEATPASDVYAIGATLLHLLTLRLPISASDESSFWARKCAGAWDEPSAEERRRIPRHLLAIVRKAMAAAVADRYATVTDLAADLRRWQSGQSISACRDTIGESLARFHRRHGRRAWTIAAIIAVVGLLAALLVGERLKRLATWGAPMMVEHFDAGWEKRWQILDGGFEARDGRVITTGQANNWLLWPQRLSGPTAIEYEAEVLPGTLNCDLSLIWCRELDPAIHDRGRMRDALLLQFGALDGSYTAITGGDQRHLAMHPRRPEVGKVHRVRCEIIDDTMTMSVDGEELVRYRDRLPLVGGYFALYGYYPGKAFGPVRVHALGVPERIPATAVGDAFAERGDNLAAAEAYGRVAALHHDTSLGHEAAYRQGLCLYRAGAPDAAFTAWASLADTPYAMDVELHRCQRLIANDDLDGALAAIATLAQDPDPAQRARVLQVWGTTVRDLRRLPGGRAWRRLQAWADLRPRLPPDLLADRDHADALLTLGRNRQVLADHPDQRYLCANALIRLQRGEEVLAQYPDQRLACYRALRAMGRFEEARQGYPAFDDPVWPLQPLEQQVRDRLVAGDIDGALALADGGPECRPALELQALAAADAGRNAELADLLSRHDAYSDAPVLSFLRVVALPLLDGGGDAVARACEPVLRDHRWSEMQIPWHTAAYLTGRIDAAAFLAQPDPAQAIPRLALLDGVRADLAGRAADAIGHYRRFLDLDASAALLEEAFARVRIARLSAP